jgi:hypothetical protein
MVIAYLFFSVLVSAAPDAENLLKKADAYRSPSAGFIANVEVVEGNGDRSAYEVYMEGNDHSIMVTKAPKRDVGRNILMIDQDMWMTIPSINRPVRISLKQKLTGQVAQGDISRMKWVGDYDVKLSSPTPEKISGKETYKLEMKAKKENLTYDRIVLTVDTKTARPLEASYQTPTGRTLKVARFEDYGPLGGQIRPRSIVISDAIQKSETSTIHLLSMKEKKFPKGFFTQANLTNPKLK